MHTTAVIPARMGSSRLPGKMLKPICGTPLLGYLIERLKRATTLDDIVVATSKNIENDAIESCCRDHDVHCFRGSEDDVLSRLLGAMDSRNADVGVVAFGDAPLLDPNIVDQMVQRFLDEENKDFVGNDLTTTYPPGMEVEVIRVSALRDADTKTVDPAVREHGTLYVRQHPETYDILNVEASGACRRPELEIEVDTAKDFRVISEIAAHFKGRIDYRLEDIISFMDANPMLSASNQDVPRRWKQYRSD